MDRRDFLKLCGLAGLSVAAPIGLSRARAQDESDLYEGTLYLVVHASGGWDPTSLCDPKGTPEPNAPNPVNRYLIDDIRSPSQSSPIRWAPFGQNDAFFERHYEKLLIINGIDTSTNSHEIGPRHIHSGTLVEGHPAFAAMAAAEANRASPMAFITNGGYDITRGLVSRTRVGNINAISRLASPEVLDLNNGTLYHTPTTQARILEASRARLEARRARNKLPSVEEAMGELVLARTADAASLKAMTGFLPALNEATATALGRQAALAIAAWRAGICVSANLSVGGFDTHGNHDATHATAMGNLTMGLDEILTLVEDEGIADRVVVVVGSDFGRTPHYNEGNGKDHWSITSMLLMGAGIEGNRVIGTTTETHRALPVDPETLEPSDEGVIIKPVHIQRALRDLAGLSGTDLDRRFPLVEGRLPIFG